MARKTIRFQVQLTLNDKMFIDSMNAAMACGATGMAVIKYALKRGKDEGFINFSFKEKPRWDDGT